MTCLHEFHICNVFLLIIRSSDPSHFITVNFFSFINWSKFEFRVTPVQHSFVVNSVGGSSKYFSKMKDHHHSSRRRRRTFLIQIPDLPCPVGRVYHCEPDARAQSSFSPGFIIRTTGDTVHGYIEQKNYPASFRKCHFKYASNAETEQYGPEDLKAYHFDNGKMFVSKNVVLNGDSTQMFLECLLDGIADIYFL